MVFGTHLDWIEAKISVRKIVVFSVVRWFELAQVKTSAEHEGLTLTLISAKERIFSIVKRTGSSLFMPVCRQ
jgi:hypothetical protein